MKLNVYKSAILGWFQKDVNPNNVTSFSYYRTSNWTKVIAVLVPLMVFETIGLHLLLSRWSAVGATVFTILSIWGILWVLGDYQLIKKSPIRLENGKLLVQIGARWDFEVPTENIKSVKFGVPDELNLPVKISMGEFTKKQKIEGYENISLSGKANLHIELKNRMAVKWPFGKSRTLKRFGLEVDDAWHFVTAVQKIIKH